MEEAVAELSVWPIKETGNHVISVDTECLKINFGVLRKLEVAEVNLILVSKDTHVVFMVQNSTLKCGNVTEKGVL